MRTFSNASVLVALMAAALPIIDAKGQDTVVVAPNGINSFDMAAGIAYWTEGAVDEFCTPTAVRKVPGGGGVLFTSLFREFPPACTRHFLHVRTDGVHVYFHDLAAETINRIWVGGRAIEMLADTTGGATDLEIDQTHV